MIISNFSQRTSIILGLLLIVVIAACSPQTRVIQVVITPTPDPDATTTTPTITPPLPISTSVPTNTPLPPSETVADAPTNVIPSETTTLTSTNTPAEPTPTFLGPVIQSDYNFIPPPTNTSAAPIIPTTTATPLPPTPPTGEVVAPQAEQPTATATTGPSPTPVPQLDASQMGLQVDTNMEFDQWQRVVALTDATGVDWLKVQVNWAFLQPNGPNDFNGRMQLFERQMEAAARPGLNVLLSIAKAPGWARSNQQEDGPPDDPQALADFITFLFTETKVGESAAAIEVWNEPNLVREWRGTLAFDGAGYMQLFAPAYNAIRAVAPDMPIITAGLAPTSNLDGAIDDRDFLQQMYGAGLANYDNIVIGAHPYGWGNPPDARCCGGPEEPGWDDNPHFFFIENIEATYEIMQRNGHDTQIWITEFGWSSWDGYPSQAPEAWLTYANLNQQADYAIRAFQIGQELPYIGLMILWNLNFANATTIGDPGTVGQEIAGFAIIDPNANPQERPLYWALRAATGEDMPLPQ